MTDDSFAVQPRNLADIIISRAATDTDRLAYAERTAQLTFGELHAEAAAIAAGLAQRGVQARDRVVLCLPAGLEFVRAFWAVQLLGAVSCALNPGTPVFTTVKRALRVRARLLFTPDEDLAREARLAGIETITQLPRESATTLRSGVCTGEEVAVLQTTSGTSGEPRAAMITHHNILTAAAAGRVMGLTPDSVMVCWVPPWHDLGLIRFLITGPYFGAACHIVPPAVHTIPEWLATIERVRGTFTGAPDFAYRLAARFAAWKNFDLSSLQHARSGGEPVRLSTIRRFEDAFGLPGVVEAGYGLAEATLGVAARRAGESLRVDERGNVSCGTALPDVVMRIEADEGSPGEILVRGPVVFAGYFDGLEETREILSDGWLRTGDIGRMDHDGHLYVLGRKRAMLKRGGSVLAPRELEEAAQEVTGVKIAAAVGLVTADQTEAIVVAVETDADSDPQRVVREVGESVRKAMGFLPERVIVLGRGSLPRTANGKLRHDVLRAALMDGTLQEEGAILRSSD